MDNRKMAMALIAGGMNQQAFDKIVKETNMPYRQARRMERRAKDIIWMHSKPNLIISKFSNWQRSQWERAGRPMEEQSLLYYFNLTKSVQ